MSLSFDLDRQSEMVDVLTQAAESLDEILEQLDAEVGAVLSSWDGSAQAAYASAQTEWLRSVQALKEALRSATGAARVAGETLARADRDAAQVWN
jgi:WXG100 family type VII secretion target